MLLLRLVLGFLLVLLGLAYLFHPTLIIKLNAFMRDNVFRDAHVLLSNRRIGTVLVLTGFILLVLTVRTVP